MLRSKLAPAAALLLSIALTAASVEGPSRRGSAAATIEGQVRMERRAPRRVVSRYDGPGGGAAHAVGVVPAVAYLEGAIPGAREAAGRPRLVQQDTSFSPALLVVPVGTAVEFPNRDGFFHNVFSYSPAKRFDLGRYPRGESRTLNFERAGVVKVYCEIHQWMRAAVVVVENPYHAQVAADGRFTIAGVPPGRYRLTVWDFERGERKVDVTVPAAGSVRVDVRM